jgi:hypothetical protein
MQNAAAIRTESWISASVAPAARARFHVLGRDLQAAFLHRSRDRQQRPHLVRHRRGLQVSAYPLDQRHALRQLCRRECRVG